MEMIDEQVSVNLLNNRPTAFLWHNRRYNIADIGLHHVIHNGRVLMHVFSVTDKTTCFTLEFNTESLLWRLCSVEDR